MIVSQHDLAQLDDDTIRRLAIKLRRADPDGPLATFWSALADGLITGLLERKRGLEIVELELLDDGRGELHLHDEPDDVARAHVDLRLSVDRRTPLQRP